MPERRRQLNPFEKVILGDLFQAQRPLSTLQLSRRNAISWEATKNNLKKLQSEGHVTTARESSRKVAWILPDWSIVYGQPPKPHKKKVTKHRRK